MKTSDKSSVDPTANQTQSTSIATEELDRRLFHISVDMAAVPTMLTTIEGVLLNVNQPFCDLLGYTEAELLSGKPLFLHADDFGEESAFHDRLKCGEIKRFSMQRRYINKSGELVWTMLNGSIIHNMAEDNAYFLTQAIDISAGKRLEQVLQEDNSLLTATLEATSEVVYIRDLQGRYLLVSPSAADFLNKSVAEIIGKTNADLFPAEQAEKFAEEDRLVLASGESHSYEHEMIIAGENRIWVSIKSVCRGRNGEPLGVLGISREITDEKKVAAALVQSEERLRRYFDAGVVGMTLVSTKTGIMDCNQTYCDITGYSYEELKGKSWQQLTSPEDLSETEIAIQRVEAGESDGYSLEKRYLRKDGTHVDVIASSRCIRNQDGEAEYFVGFVQDITALKQSQQALMESEGRFRSAFDNAATAMSITAPSGKYLKVNRAMCKFIGYPEQELLSMDWQSITHPEDLEKSIVNSQQLRAGEIDTSTLEKRYLDKSGAIRWGQTNIAPLHDAEGRLSGVIVQIQDITEARQLSEQLSYQATHDSLTGLVNRLEFEQRLGRVLKTAKKAKTENALAYFDLDQFKVINDTCGHVAGDELLRLLAELLNGKVRHRDTLARLGGDEFGLLMEGCSLENAWRVASGLRETVEQFQFIWEDKRFNIGVSIGLVALNEDSGNITEIFKQADAACYVAKEGGRNRIHVFYAEDKDLIQRHGEMQWVTRITEALEENRLQLVFQPIIPITGSAQTGKRYEALLRLEDREGKIIGPRAFLPAAERYGLAVRLDQWVVQRVVELYEEYPEFSAGIANLSINLSGLSLGDDAFLDFLSITLNTGRLPAEKLCFEITETAAISNLSKAIQFIKALQAWGCGFALDDFGSGLSSFAYLKSLPVDVLKIDGMFVKDIVEDPISYFMVKSINEMGHLMNKQTIAEHVENEAILEKLRELGVDFGQGEHLGKPESIENILTSRS